MRLEAEHRNRFQALSQWKSCILKWEQQSDIFQIISVVFLQLNSLFMKSPAYIPKGTQSQLLNVPFLQTLLLCVQIYIRAGACMQHVCVRACSCVCFLCVRLGVSVCSFLVSGCEICGFSQSVLIFVSLSLSQQIIVKYTHTEQERGRVHI